MHTTTCMNSSLFPLAGIHDKTLLLLHALSYFVHALNLKIISFKENTWLSGQKPVICLLMNSMLHTGFSSPLKSI